MPGPGGGAHGGGGFSGNFGGGSSGGSSGGGGRPPYRGGTYIYFGSGRNASGMSLGSIIFVTLILLVFAVILMIIGFGKTGQLSYDEDRFQDYADARYAEVFADSEAYEDNILLVVLVDPETHKDFYFIAWVGDDISAPVSYLFGDEDSKLGKKFGKHVNRNSYKYSLGKNLAAVVGEMKEEICATGSSPYTCTETHVRVASELVNKSDMDVAAAPVNAALAEFTEGTGIPMVVVVDNADRVFKKNSVWLGVLGLVFLLGAAALVAVTVIKKIKGKKPEEKVERSAEKQNSGSGFDF